MQLDFDKKGAMLKLYTSAHYNLYLHKNFHIFCISVIV